MNKTQEEIIARVRKLLALGDAKKGGTEAEVNTALEMANKLMRENDLSMSQIELKRIEDEGALDKAATFRKNCVPWERTLGMAVADLSDTSAYRTSRYRDGGIHFTMSFIGVGADADFATAAYDSLNETLRMMGKKSVYRGAEQQSYLLGVATRIAHRARDLKAEREAIAKKAKEEKMQAAQTCEVPTRVDEPKDETAPVEQYALVVVKHALIEAKLKTMKMRNIRQGNMGGSRWSYEEGKRAGDGVNLNLNKQLE